MEQFKSVCEGWGSGEGNNAKQWLEQREKETLFIHMHKSESKKKAATTLMTSNTIMAFG